MYGRRPGPLDNGPLFVAAHPWIQTTRRPRLGANRVPVGRFTPEGGG